MNLQIWLILLFPVAVVLASVISFRRGVRSSNVQQEMGELRQELHRQTNEKVKFAQRLEGSEARLRRGIDEVGAALWEWDFQGDQVFVSDLIMKATGFEPEDIGTKPESVFGLIHPDDQTKVEKSLKNLKTATSSEATLEIRMRYKDGEYHWIHTRIIATHDSDGKPQRLVGSFADITGRISAEEERDRLFNLSIDMLAVWGFDGMLQQVNPAWVRVLGWSRDDLMGRPLLFFVHPEDHELTNEAFDAIFSGQPIEELDMRFRCRNGTYLWLSWSSFPYPDREVVFSVVKDITHNKTAERKLLDYQERLRSLSAQLSLVEDRQRKELASAIHDGLAQQLFGIRAKVTLMKFPEKSPNLAELVAETLSIIDETMNQARSLSFELFPPVLHEVGLEAALSWLAHQYQETTQISCTVSVDGTGPQLSEDTRTMAFQSVRELLANIRKHADTKSCSIAINHVDGFLTILVEDQGRGFDFAAARDRNNPNDPSSGFGLFSIRERMRSVQGRMLVDSHPGKGCRVFLTFPNEGGSFPLPSEQIPES